MSSGRLLGGHEQAFRFCLRILRSSAKSTLLCIEDSISERQIRALHVGLQERTHQDPVISGKADVLPSHLNTKSQQYVILKIESPPSFISSLLDKICSFF